jgi:hypothetical protein
MFEFTMSLTKITFWALIELQFQFHHDFTKFIFFLNIYLVLILIDWTVFLSISQEFLPVTNWYSNFLIFCINKHAQQTDLKYKIVISTIHISILIRRTSLNPSHTVLLFTPSFFTHSYVYLIKVFVNWRSFFLFSVSQE